MSWFKSYLPSLPSLPTLNFPIPTVIQGRFISFILKKSLGHLLKPGQLDYSQIDSQIGSGYVQVNSLELDPDAINVHLAGQSIALHSGTISSVKARIPWPNPLASTLGFSVNSVHLVFHVVPPSPTRASGSRTSHGDTEVDLAGSVATVAESFIHEELSPKDERQIWESFHPAEASARLNAQTQSQQQTIPGGLGGSSAHDDIPDPDPTHRLGLDKDPAGISVFASLIESLLARFEFDAKDIQITIVYPNVAHDQADGRVKLQVEEVRYFTEVKAEDIQVGGEEVPGETRTLSISGVALSLGRLNPLPGHPPFGQPTQPTTFLGPLSPQTQASTPKALSRASSSSSLDEDMHLAMSQSIVGLPGPRFRNLAESVASSLYESALDVSEKITEEDESNEPNDPEMELANPSLPEGTEPSPAVAPIEPTAEPASAPEPVLAPMPSEPEPEPEDRREEEKETPQDELILMFGSQPILIRLTTPSPSPSPAPSSGSVDPFADHPPSNAPSRRSDAREGQEGRDDLQSSISIHIIACALKPWHVRTLLALGNALGGGSSSSSPNPHAPLRTSKGKETQKAGGFNLPPLKLDAKLRGLVLLLDSGPDSSPLQGFFNHPLIPPKSTYGYTRVHVDGVSVTGRVSGPTTTTDKTQTMRVNIDASVVDLSVFTFIPTMQEGEGDDSTQEHTHIQTLQPFPLLLTDPYLPTQYPARHVHPSPPTSFTNSSPNTASRYPSLPTFDILDWTDERRVSAGKMSYWRTKVAGEQEIPGGKKEPAVRVRGSRSVYTTRSSSSSASGDSARRRSGRSSTSGRMRSDRKMKTKTHTKDELDVRVSPLHIRVDLEGMFRPGGMIEYLERVMPPSSTSSSGGAEDELLDPLDLEGIYEGGEDQYREGGEGYREDGEEDSEGSNDTLDEFKASMLGGASVARGTKREHTQQRRRKTKERGMWSPNTFALDEELDPFGEPGEGGDVLPRKTRSENNEDKDKHETIMAITLPMTRVSVRCPSPPKYEGEQRSGIVVVDVHDVVLSIGSGAGATNTAPTTKSQQTRFARDEGIINLPTTSPGSSPLTQPQSLPPILAGLVTPRMGSVHPKVSEGSDITEESVHMKVQFRRAMLGSSIPDISGKGRGNGLARVVGFASIGGLSDDVSTEDKYRYGLGERTGPAPAPIQPCIRILKPQVAAQSSPSSPKMTLSIDIPAIQADLSKSSFDGLQYFADDLTQFFERLGQGQDQGRARGGEEMPTTEGGAGGESLIGSRFFARSRAGSMSTTTGGDGGGSGGTAESVVKVTVTEAFVRLGVPRTDGGLAPRPFDLRASDLDVLLELNPDGKQQTLLTVDIMDISVSNGADDGSSQTFLKLSSPHSLKTAPKSLLKLRFSTAIAPETGRKETRIKLTLCGFTYSFFADLTWVADLTLFAKNPPGTFEAVIPTDCTRIFVKILDGSIQIFAPTHPGALVSHLQELEFSTDVVGDSKDSSFRANASSLSVLALDEGARLEGLVDPHRSLRGVAAWMASGYALVFEVPELDTVVVNHVHSDPQWKVDIHRLGFRLHMCADTMTAVSAIFSDLGNLGKSEEERPAPVKNEPSILSSSTASERDIMSSVEDLQFKKVPELGPAPDMINDDLPTNLYYLDDSFGPAGGLREITDDDLDDFDNDAIAVNPATESDPSVISRVGGETIKLLDPIGLEVVEDYFLTIPPESTNRSAGLGDSKISVRVFEGNFNVFLYDGYDWAKTRKIIEEEVKEMRKRLAKIRQLVANGQVEDPSLEDTSALLYNSIHIGLDDDEDALGEPAALLAAIDRELTEDLETTSWQSLPTFHGGPSSSKPPRTPSARIHGKRLTRSRAPSIEFSLQGLRADFDKFHDDDPLVSRTFVTVRDVEILDHIKTSTWKKFLTQLRADSKGNVRETDSDMVRIELKGVRPVLGHSSEEARLKAKILPLRLYVDQDAVDFLKKFFSFKDPHAEPSSETSESEEAYIQHGEIFPIDLKLDYKPRRVDYRALKQGRTIELMNFFHFDGAEMTLRHITLAGITGWGKFFELLNDLWTPDVKATQLAEVISGVAPIRSVVNVGSGVADLILLPIAQYKKDGRIVRGVQKGAKAFVKSTAIEAIKMGAQLATGTQVILEHAETILGGIPDSTVTAETLQVGSGDDFDFENEELDEDAADRYSKYAQQPADLKEGVQHAYKSLQRNLSSAAQTILAVPMEVYERSGNEGPVRSVIRAVPIAVLKPMIGASEAVSKTLQGLHNTLDPNVRHENEAKYKLR